MRTHGTLRAVAVALLVAVLVTSCATNRYPPGDATLLSFLTDGTTTRDDAMLRLGQPSATFQSEHILTYRLGYHEESGYFVETPSTISQWNYVRYSLVLVFDANGTLLKHSLVTVQ